MSLPHVILTILSTKESTGYDITKEFSSQIGYFWKASHQQVYRELNKMAEKSLVTCILKPQDGKPDRKIYSITNEGKNALNKWFALPIYHPTVRDEFSAKLMACTVQPALQYANQLKELISESFQFIAYYKDIQSSLYANGELSQKERIERLTIRRNLLMREAWIVWAQEVINEIEASLNINQGM